MKVPGKRSRVSVGMGEILNKHCRVDARSAETVSALWNFLSKVCHQKLGAFWPKRNAGRG